MGSYLWQLIENIMDFFIRKLFHIKISDDKWETFVQFVKFGVVGVTNTVISYVIYVASLLILQNNKWLEGVDYLVAQVIAFILSVLWSFYWNNKYVFIQSADTERSLLKALIKTYISYSFTGLFLNSILSVLWVEVLGISKMVAPIINLLVSVPLNFFMNKFWAFKDKS